MFNPNLDQNIFNTIIVETNDNKSLILHEVGHFIDFCFGEIKCKYSGNIELKKIILKQRSYDLEEIENAITLIDGVEQAVAVARENGIRVGPGRGSAVGSPSISVFAQPANSPRILR